MIDPATREKAEVYFTLLERYQHLPLEQSLPILAVRWLALDVGFDKLIEELRTLGGPPAIPYVTICSLRAIARYQRFIEQLLEKYPPSPEALEGVVTDSERIREAADLQSTRDRIALFLTRILARENALHPVDPKKLH